MPVRLAFLSLRAGMTEVAEQHEAGYTQVETVQYRGSCHRRISTSSTHASNTATTRQSTMPGTSQ